MSDKKDENNFDEFNDDMEYHFEDDTPIDADEIVDEGDSLEEVVDAELVDAGGAGKKAGGAAIAGVMGGKMKPIFMGLGIIILVGIMYVMLGGGANKDGAGAEAAFVAGSAKEMKEPTSPFDNTASTKSSVQDDFLAELDVTPTETTEVVEEVVPKEPEVAMVDEKQLDKQLGMAVEGIKKELRDEFSKAVAALKNQDEQVRSGLEERYDNKVSQAEMKVAELNKQYDATLSEIDSLQRELASLKTEMQSLQKQQAISTKNQKRIMYNQGMSFNASGEAMTRMGDDEVPVATATQQVMNNNIVYNVQAVVPGRAWLMNDAGKSITVAVGDKLPGFGVIVDIDALNGVVVTSSGKLLTATQ